MIFEASSLAVVGLLIDASLSLLNAPYGIATAISILIDVASAPGVGRGSYPTYTVTKTKYISHKVEVANYHGYRVYGYKQFKYTEIETYMFMDGEIVSINKTYSDEHQAYRYRNHQ